jgi:hypothetical protein
MLLVLLLGTGCCAQKSSDSPKAPTTQSDSSSGADSRLFAIPESTIGGDPVLFVLADDPVIRLVTANVGTETCGYEWSDTQREYDVHIFDSDGNEVPQSEGMERARNSPGAVTVAELRPGQAYIEDYHIKGYFNFAKTGLYKIEISQGYGTLPEHIYHRAYASTVVRIVVPNGN